METQTTVETVDQEPKGVNVDATPDYSEFEDEQPTETQTDAQDKTTTPPDETNIEDAPEDGDDKGGEIDEALMNSAKSYGLTEADVEALGGEQALKTALTLLDRHALNAVQNQPAQQRLTPPQKVDEPAAAKFELEFEDESLADPDELLKNLKAMNEHYARQVQNIQGQMETQKAAARVERFEEQINQLGDEYADIYGKGDMRDLNQHSPQRAKRIELYQTMNALRRGLAAQNAPIPKESELFRRALNAHSGDIIIQKRAKTEQTAKRKEQMIAPPDDRKNPNPHLTGTKKAIRGVEDYLQKKGVSYVRPDYSDEYAEFES